MLCEVLSMSSLPIRGELVLATLLRAGKDGVTTTQDVRRWLDPSRGANGTEYSTLTRDELTGDWSYTFRELDKMGLIDRNMDVTTQNGGQGPAIVKLTEKRRTHAERLLEAKKWQITKTEVDETIESLGTDLSAVFRRVATAEARIDEVEEGVVVANQGVEEESFDDLRTRVDDIESSMDELHERLDAIDERVTSVHRDQSQSTDQAEHTEQLALGLLKLVEDDLEGKYGICVDCREFVELATENRRREGYCLKHALEMGALPLDDFGDPVIPDYHSEA